MVGNERSTLFSAGILSTRMHPGHSIVVPEKVIGGSMLWRNLIGTAQIASAFVLPLGFAGVL